MGETLDARRRDRYSRQLLVDSIGEPEQERLLSASALVVGAGGLGSAAIQYLAAAGVGTLGIVDDGVVKRSNLQRQVVHGVADVGEPKVESAARFVDGLNPDVTVETHEVRIEPDTAESVLDGYDAIVDGLDEFPARFLVNDVARLEEIPFVHGAVYGFEGQTAVFRPGGPCYRCLLPAAPEPDAVPSGEPIGVFATLPGVVGCLQATEALKYLASVGDLLDDRVLRYDGTDATITTTPLEANPDCPVCGPDGIDSIEAVDYTGSRRIE